MKAKIFCLSLALENPHQALDAYMSLYGAMISGAIFFARQKHLADAASSCIVVRGIAVTHRQTPVWARGRCRISPPRFLAECCKRQLNQVSLVVLLYFSLSAFSDLY